MKVWWRAPPPPPSPQETHLVLDACAQGNVALCCLFIKVAPAGGAGDKAGVWACAGGHRGQGRARGHCCCIGPGGLHGLPQLRGLGLPGCLCGRRLRGCCCCCCCCCPTAPALAAPRWLGCQCLGLIRHGVRLGVIGCALGLEDRGTHTLWLGGRKGGGVCVCVCVSNKWVGGHAATKTRAHTNGARAKKKNAPRACPGPFH